MYIDSAMLDQINKQTFCSSNFNPCPVWKMEQGNNEPMFGKQ